MSDKSVAADAQWTDPGPVPVAAGIHRIPLPMPNDGLKAVNVYAVADGAGLTMIDGGWAIAGARATLERALDEIGYGLRDITRFLVTHSHRDHLTLAVALRREFGTPIGLGAGERESIRTILSRGPILGPQVELLRAAGAGELVDRLGLTGRNIDPADEGYEEPDEYLDAGTIRIADRSLRVIPTPGHTRGHIVFADEATGVLFAGDHVLPHITPSIGFEPVPSPTSLSDYLDSLEAMRKLPDLTLLPAHGPVVASTHTRVGELIAHHDERLAEMTGAVASLGSATGLQVADAVGWTRRRRAFSSLDPFNQMLAVTETVAHLRLLVTTGILTEDRAAIPTYRVTAPTD